MLNSAIIIKCYCIIIADIESTSINATRFALSIALPLVFVFILVGLIVINWLSVLRIITRKPTPDTPNIIILMS